LTLLVLDEWSQPIQGVQVTSFNAKAITDCHGLANLDFQFNGAGHSSPTQQWWCNLIAFSAPGYEVNHVSAGGRVVPRVVWLREGRRISGTCVDPTGDPVAGLKLELRSDQREPVVEFTTDGNGRFATTEAGARVYTFVLNHPRWIASLNRVIPPEEDLRVSVFRPARLTGRLQFSISGRRWTTLGGCVWQLRVSPPGRQIRTESEGTFAFDCVPGWVTLALGDHVLARMFLHEGEPHDAGVLVIPAEGYGDTECRNNHEASDENDAADTRIDTSYRTGRVHGYLMGSSGQPVAHGALELCRSGTRCSVSGVEAKCLWAERYMRFSTPPGWLPRSDERFALRNGTFELAGVPPGVYDLVWTPGAWQPGVRAVLCRTIRMPNPAMDIDLGTLTLDLKPTAFCVRVRKPDGSGVHGTLVRLMDGDRVEAAARTDVAGLAAFRVFDPAGLVIEVGGPEGTTVRRALPVTAGQSSAPVTFTIEA
jgi:hypothetical protein